MPRNITKLRRLLARFGTDRSGLTAVQYGLLAALIGVLVIPSINFSGGATNNRLMALAEDLESSEDNRYGSGEDSDGASDQAPAPGGGDDDDDGDRGGDDDGGDDGDRSGGNDDGDADDADDKDEKSDDGGKKDDKKKNKKDRKKKKKRN